MTSENANATRELIIDAIRDRKGHSITIVDLSDISGAQTGEFIIAEGNSTTQVGSIADHLRRKLLEDHDIKPYNYDGMNAGEWVVMDYGDIWVHVFLPETRRRYNLEELWCDANITEIPDLD